MDDTSYPALENYIVVIYMDLYGVSPYGRYVISCVRKLQ